MTGFFKKVLAILWKDILSELRTREIAASVLIFAIMVIVVFNFAFAPGTDTIGQVAPGVLWVTFIFAGVLSLNKTFAQEKEKDCIEGLMLCPVDRTVIYWGKMAGSLVFMLAVEAIVIPVFLVLFNLPLFMPGLALIALLATIGFVSTGTLFSALAVNTRARDIMLPILFFPIATPVIIAAVKASEVILNAGAWETLSPWLQILVAFDVIFMVISALVFEFVVEE